ncbi:hypothetical protein UlMin_032382 [Ulmus minor]
MALRFQYLILFFSFVLLMGCSNGARDVVEKDRKLHDQAGYITGYKTTKGEEVEDAKDTSQSSYITGYRNIKETSQSYIPGYKNVKGSSQPYITSYKNVKGSSQPYITGYRNVKGSSQPYITGYRNVKGSSQPYITDYRNVKGSSQPYITGYRNVKEPSQPYITSYGDAKETSHPYITSYGDAKETSQPYITSYEDAKETSQPYITSYGDVKESSQPYITQYGDAKETSQPYITSYGDVKESSQPYITQYGDVKETNQPYTTSYGDVKETIQSYVTSYGDAENTNKRPYYGNAKETKKGPYVTGYGTGYGTSQDPKSKCNDHVHSSSHNGGHEHKGHEHHMHTQSSNGLDQNEAFKVGFFIPKNLYAGKTMPLYFPIKDHSGFLPKEVADSIPFSLSQLPNLLQLFSIPQGSPEAKEMEQTLLECRAEPIDAEIKLCATSLESMVDFVNRILGSDQNQFNLLSTTHPTITTALTQNYTVLEAPKEVSAPKMVFCHPEPYPYAVFFCHYFGTETKVFQVSLSGESGDKVDAIAVCHMDTSDWDPNHVLFQMLGVKPGASSPVCHFLPANHLVWLPSPTKATA